MAAGNRITLVPPEHWLLPADLPTRYASAIAEVCGMRVSVEVPGRPSIYPLVITWRGSEAQFRATGFVVKSQRFDFKSARIRFCPVWLRGHLHREGPDKFRFDIESANDLSKIQEGKISRLAAGHDCYQAFRQVLLVWAPEAQS